MNLLVLSINYAPEPTGFAPHARIYVNILMVCSMELPSSLFFKAI